MTGHHKNDQTGSDMQTWTCRKIITLHTLVHTQPRCVPCDEAELLSEHLPQLFCIVLLYLQPFLHKLCIALQEVDAPLRVLVEVLKLVLREEVREHRLALSGEQEVRELRLSLACLSKTGYMKRCDEYWWFSLLLMPADSVAVEQTSAIQYRFR